VIDVYDAIGKFMLRRRLPILVLILLLTAFFLWHALQVKVESPTIDLFPSDHQYVETFKNYKDVFGGAATVLIAVEAVDGDIFNVGTLEKIKRISKEIELLPGINNYQVLSLSQRKVKELRVHPESGFLSIPLMWPDVPQTEEEMHKLRESVYTSPRYFGTLVSLDSKAALIVAGFFEEKFNPEETYRKIENIIALEEDSGTRIYAIGRPVMLGWILKQYPQIYKLFFLTLISIIAVLALYFRDLRGTLLPLSTAVMSAIWGVGFLGLMGYNFDPLVIVVPFIISERALSHSVQVVERFLDEYEGSRDRYLSSLNTFKGLFAPGMLAILTDALGVFLVFTTPIPLLQKLAIMGGFWVLSIIISDLVFNPILLSYLPAPKTIRNRHKGFLYNLLVKVGGWSFGRQRIYVLGVTVALLAIGFLFARDLKIGDVHPGTPMLWPDSKYNQDTEAIAKRFGNTELLSVVVEGKDRNSIKNPEVLRTMEAFQKKMESLPVVSGSSSIADYLPGIISIIHGSDPKWELIPDDPMEAGFFLEMIYTNSEPGDLDRFVTSGSQNANITLYLNDHKGETLRNVVKEAKDFIEKHPMEEAKFRLAGSYGGLLAAINEVVTYNQAKISILAFSIILVVTIAAYRSLWAGLFFLLPVIISNYLTYALMGARQIGLDVNALPVVALGVGLGVDYGLYVVNRIREEYAQSGDLQQAIVTGVSTAGKAVVFTAGTVIAGVAFWTLSFLRFQAEMGLLLVFWMVVAMLGSVTLLPALVYLLKPKFIVGRPGNKESLPSQ